MLPAPEPPLPMTATPYEQALGDDFHRLAPVLQRLHSGPHMRTAQGAFRVERGENRIARVIAAVMRLPRAMPDVALRLRIESTGRGECWRRWFGAQEVVTWQAAEGSWLRESFAPFAMLFALHVEHGNLYMKSRRMRMLGIPLPGPLAPQITASEEALDDGWRVEVEIRLPLVGRLVRYSGAMKLT